MGKKSRRPTTDDVRRRAFLKVIEQVKKRRQRKSRKS